jgi:hypothetical protein
MRVNNSLSAGFIIAKAPLPLAGGAAASSLRSE